MQEMELNSRDEVAQLRDIIAALRERLEATDGA
jgi:hypothetical protein